ncbi:glycosyl hydrolases family 31-domain-containing protein [Entophlyctis helioformis]|nr:glycosyl hydrolases family 31-domain-containing protein [Entophlyctis helioformis]
MARLGSHANAPFAAAAAASHVWLLLLAAALLLLQPVAMVKQHDFKTCAQSGFCTRQRAYADLVDRAATENTTYSFVPSSLVLDEAAGRISAQLMGLEPTDVFTVNFHFLKNGVVRLLVDERDPLFPRYSGAATFGLNSAGDGLASISFAKDAVSKDEVRVRFGPNGAAGSPLPNVLTIRPNPFRFELAVNNVPAITFNERGYMLFEPHRKRDDINAVPRFAKKMTAPVPEPAAGDDPSSDAASNAAPADPNAGLDAATIELNNIKDRFASNMWEEDFGGKQDSKPRGPASIGVDISFPGSSNVYGLPEHASGFSLKTTRGEGAPYSEPYRLYNLDVFEYELDNPMALYGSIPFMISHKRASLLLQLSNYVPFGTKQTSAMSVDTHWMAESGVMDLFFFLGPTQADIFNAYTELTGRPTMPQLFSVAYHQCRWNYNNEEDVKSVDANFDAHDIPYDVLWLDIEHTDGKRYFTWDSTKFPTPEKMQDNLAAKKRKMVTIIDPHIKKDPNYHVSKQALDAGLFVKKPDGEAFDGWCWPGDSNWIDYTNPAAREFWASKFAFGEYKGSTRSLYTWNDMNEPSVFSGPEITMPKDCVHHEGAEHRDVHNIYGMLQHRSTFEGQLARSGNTDRPFVLSRAFFVGTQRYGAIWTGDNFARWDHLAASVPMLLSIGVSGVVFAGADVGGFFENPDAELLLRWYQIGSLQPFFRAHAHIDTKRREPWLFGEPYTRLIRDAVRRRYKLLPYIYTLFAEASRTGMPVMRPLVAEFADDEATFALDDQYLLGSALLIKPVTAKDQASVDVYLPKTSLWYNYETLGRVAPDAKGMFTLETPLDVVPVFLRGGSIVPRRDRVRRSSALTKADPYTLLVALDKDGSASGTLYVDDGSTYAFRDQGVYTFTTLTFKGGKLTAKTSRLPDLASTAAGSSTAVSASAPEIAALQSRVERVIVVGLSSEPKAITGAAGEVSFKVHRAASNTLVVTAKNPGVVMGLDWSIDFA